MIYNYTNRWRQYEILIYLTYDFSFYLLWEKRRRNANLELEFNEIGVSFLKTDQTTYPKIQALRISQKQEDENNEDDEENAYVGLLESYDELDAAMSVIDRRLERRAGPTEWNEWQYIRHSFVTEYRYFGGWNKSGYNKYGVINYLKEDGWELGKYYILTMAAMGSGTIVQGLPTEEERNEVIVYNDTTLKYELKTRDDVDYVGDEECVIPASIQKRNAGCNSYRVPVVDYYYAKRIVGSTRLEEGWGKIDYSGALSSMLPYHKHRFCYTYSWDSSNEIKVLEWAAKAILKIYEPTKKWRKEGRKGNKIGKTDRD